MNLDRELTTQKRIRTAAILVFLGLAIAGMTLLWESPMAFLVFLGGTVLMLFRESFWKALQAALFWIVVALVVALGYTYRFELRTVYELSGPASRTHERCRNNLDRLNSEIELLIRKAWPSHRAALRRLGVA